MVADAAAVRASCGGTGFPAASRRLFAQDMPRRVPAARWDVESPGLLGLGGRAPVRFAGFLDGACRPVVMLLVWAWDYFDTSLKNNPHALLAPRTMYFYRADIFELLFCWLVLEGIFRANGLKFLNFKICCAYFRGNLWPDHT